MTGLRENLNKYPLAIIGGVAFVVAVVFLGVHHGQKQSPLELSKAYYTTDDGETYSVGSIPPPGPSDKVQAMLFGCSEAKPFVGYLQRQGADGTEVKKPGAGNPWVAAPPPMTPQSAPADLLAMRKAYEQITHVTCPDGGIANLLMPE